MNIKNEKISVFSIKIMLLMGNKSEGAIFGTFICRFHILTALSEINIPLKEGNVRTDIISVTFCPWKSLQAKILNYRT